MFTGIILLATTVVLQDQYGHWVAYIEFFVQQQKNFFILLLTWSLTCFPCSRLLYSQYFQVDA